MKIINLNIGLNKKKLITICKLMFFVNNVEFY